KVVSEWDAEDGEEESEESLPAEGPAQAGAARKGLPEKKKKKLLDAKTWERDAHLVETATALRKELGDKLFEDHNVFRERVDEALAKLKIKPSASDLKLILHAVSWRVETAPPVIAKVHKLGKGGRATAIQADPLRGLFPLERGSVSRSTSGDSKPLRVTEPCSEIIVEYEPDSDL